MNLKRYNEYLWAALGTLLVVVAVVAIFWLVRISTTDRQPPQIQVADAGTPKPQQQLVFCRPTIVRDSAVQLLPVAVVNVEELDDDPVLSSGAFSLYSSRSYISTCRIGRSNYSGHVFNVVVRDRSSGAQRLLLTKPGQIASLSTPDEECAVGKGPLPCDLLMWQIREADTNGDGVINDNDALTAFVSDLSARELTPVTPRNTVVLSFVWDVERSSLLFQVRNDRNGDDEFGPEDGSVLLETALSELSATKPVVSPQILKALEQAIK